MLSTGARATFSIDIDEVLGGFIPAFGRWVPRYGLRAPEPERWTSYHLSELLGVSTERVAEIIGEFYAEGLDTLEPVPGAVDAVADLGGHLRLVVITARPEWTRAATEAWLDLHFPGAFDAVLFGGFASGERVAKSTLCRHIGADVHVDDHLDHIVDVVAGGVRGVLFDGGYPYNRDLELPAGALRAVGWGEVPASLSRFGLLG